MLTKPIQIALVDDHRLFRSGIAALIDSFGGYNILFEAAHGQELIRSIDSGLVPDIILLDINMPGMGGIEMLRKLSVKQMIKPVVIMLTNNTFAGYRDECMRLGADYFLDKSRDFLMIPSIVEKVQERNFLQF